MILIVLGYQCYISCCRAEDSTPKNNKPQQVNEVGQEVNNEESSASTKEYEIDLAENEENR